MAAQPLKISEVEERELRRRAGQYTRPYREVIRAKVILLAAEGLTDVEIAARLDCSDRMAAKPGSTAAVGGFRPVLRKE